MLDFRQGVWYDGHINKLKKFGKPDVSQGRKVRSLLHFPPGAETAEGSSAARVLSFSRGGGTIAAFFTQMCVKQTAFDIGREGCSMTLSEAYDKMGGDYKDVIGRFYSADLVERFLKKFPDDQSYSKLCEAFAQNDVKTAFCAAHTLKGICQNLAIANLAQPLYTMTELLRAERLEEARVLLPEVQTQYGITVEAIREYSEHPEM